MNKMWKEGQEVTPIAQLDWKVIESDPDKTFMASGLEFVPLPVTYSNLKPEYIRLFLLPLGHFILYQIFLSNYRYCMVRTMFL